MNKITEKYIQKIPGWLEIDEGRFLEQITYKTESLNGDIVEVGSFCGKSTIYLAQSKRKVYAVDPHKGDIGEDKKYSSTYKKFLKNLKETHVSHNVVPMVLTSIKAAKKWKKSIRILFIDGLHDKKNAEQDFMLWNPYVVNNGIIAIHDSFCRWCGSEEVAINKIIRSNNFYKIGVVGSIVYGIKGKGTPMQKFIKFFLGRYLIFRIKLNHYFIILKNLSLLKNKIKTNLSFN
jgi:MMP 1-O-methyltransferase